MNEKILLVDDEEGIRKVLSISLSDIGYEVFTAENGEAALQVFKKESPLIVLTDIKMPGMNGIELLKKVKHENPDTEVIMITGHGDMDLAIESLKHKATDFVTKPINDDILQIALKKARDNIIIREKMREYTTSLEKLLHEKSVLQDRLSSLGLRIGSISHGIKGLLTGLDGGVYLVDSGFKKGDAEKTREGWDIVKVVIGRIRQMMQDILFYAKERALKFAEIDVLDFAADVAAVVEPRIDDQQIGFERDFDSPLGTFKVDAGYLRPAIVNILENAVDACVKDTFGRDPKIVFSVKAEHGAIDFSVSDNGIGMDAETKEMIFELFYSSKGSEGTGLGLYISNHIVQQHGGSITVDSHPGRGSRFLVKIPKNPPES
jgi:signal transduction histidine kinase